MKLRERMASERSFWKELRIDLFKKRLPAFIKGEGGAAAVYFVLSAPVWIAGLGLGAEVGHWYYVKQYLQNTADALADSIAVRVGSGASPTELEYLAEKILKWNHFSFSQGGWEYRVTENGAPEYGSNVEVKIKRSVPRFLTAFFQEGDFEIHARAVSRVKPSTPGCILSLGRASGDWLQVNSSANIQVTGCEVLANSLSWWAFSVGPGSVLATDCARTAGRFDIRGQLAVTCEERKEEAGYVLDPYADLPEPDPEDFDCTRTSYTINNTNPMPATDQYLPDDTPVYKFCSGLTIDKDLELPNGLYIIEGGDLLVKKKLTGTGVTFYFTEDASSQASAINLWNGPSQTDLSAPVAGSYTGILFFGGRTNTNAFHSILGTSGSSFTGAMYFPTAPLWFGATGSLGGCTMMIARSVTLTGTWQSPGPCLAPQVRPIVASREIKLIE